jgi:hypothetical protein
VQNPTLGKPMYNYSIRNRILGSQAYPTLPASGVVRKKCVSSRNARELQLSASKGYSTRAEEQPIAIAANLNNVVNLPLKSADKASRVAQSQSDCSDCSTRSRTAFRSSTNLAGETAIAEPRLRLDDGRESADIGAGEERSRPRNMLFS